jgi:peptidyl-prolyl cis-trans isomerase SurA
MIEMTQRPALDSSTRNGSRGRCASASGRLVSRARTGLALAGIAVTALLAAAPVRAEKQLLEGIVVRVNERIVTTHDFARRLQEREAESGKPLTTAQLPAMVDEAVADLCLLERAGELKIEVEDADVDNAVKGLKEQNGVTDDTSFENTLRSMGLTVAGLRARLRETITINRVLSKEVGNLPLTEAELKARYERDKDSFRLPDTVHLYHVIFAIDTEPDSEQRAMSAANRLAAAVRAGEDFAKLAGEQIASGKATGGDLGLVRVPDLRKEVGDAIATLKPGELSQPFKTATGVHLVKVLARVAASVKPFADVVEELRDKEIGERYRARMTGIVEGLKKRYIVETHPELVSR